jgi:hypothetical protein
MYQFSGSNSLVAAKAHTYVRSLSSEHTQHGDCCLQSNGSTTKSIEANHIIIDEAFKVGKSSKSLEVSQHWLLQAQITQQ